MKILLNYNDWGSNVERQLENEYGGIGYYRIINPSRMIKGHEVTVMGKEIGKVGESLEKKWSRIFKEYDVVWTTYFSNPQEASAMYYHRDKYGKKVIIDLDDNYLDPPETHHLYDKLKPEKKDRAYISTILAFADIITVSTEPLKQRLLAHFASVSRTTGTKDIEKKIVVLPNMNFKEDWQFKTAPKNDDKIVIGYSGSNSHNDDLAMFLPHLGKIMDKYKNVYFECIGSIDLKHIHLFNSFSKNAMERSDLLPSTKYFKLYPEHLAQQKWDIGVAPLVDTVFTRSKSHIKYLEYSVYKIPTIASRVYPYHVPIMEKEIISNDETGLLVKPSEWFNALEELILNKEERIRLGENAHRHVTENWQYNEEFSKRITEMLNSLN